VNISKQLIHCPDCESTLIQIESLHPLAPEGTVVERRCPECGLAEELELPSAVADLLCHHAAELSACLSELADRLEAAGELWLSEPESSDR
jgi:hypothetical protein